MRVGIVVKVISEKKIGFIRSDGLKVAGSNIDVFFHESVVQQVGTRPLGEGDEVEFEIDELHRIQKKEQLKATMVRRSVRPLTAKIQPSDAPKLRAKHHPKARKRRPDWRKKAE